MAAGQLVASGNEFDIVSFYMGNSGQYIVFALLLAAAGYILQRNQAVQKEPVSVENSVKNEAADYVLDEWFDDVGKG